MTNKLLPSLAALTLLAPTIQAQREIRTTPSQISHQYANQTTPIDFVHDYLRTHPTDLRNLERNTNTPLTHLFDNHYNNEELVDLSRRGSTLVIGTTDEPRYGRIENGQIVSPGYDIKTLQLRNPQEVDDLMARINDVWKESQPSTQPSTRPTQPYQPQEQQETVKPKKKKGLSDLEKAGLIVGGLAIGYKVLSDDDHRYRGYGNTRYYSRGSKQRGRASRSVFRNRRPQGYYPPTRRCR
ncbi:hypothetical protein CL618_01300 [archaeon]|nr:hypothetical protein [archaeon]|tara:strand:+ start:179 stop:898 length:720 start_codon:yes stop_codon:yes gene_type:complete